MQNAASDRGLHSRKFLFENDLKNDEIHLAALNLEMDLSNDKDGRDHCMITGCLVPKTRFILSLFLTGIPIFNTI